MMPGGKLLMPLSMGKVLKWPAAQKRLKGDAPSAPGRLRVKFFFVHSPMINYFRSYG
jgi:hypothetical protein